MDFRIGVECYKTTWHWIFASQHLCFCRRASALPEISWLGYVSCINDRLTFHIYGRSSLHGDLRTAPSERGRNDLFVSGQWSRTAFARVPGRYPAKPANHEGRRFQHPLAGYVDRSAWENRGYLQ